MPQTGNRVYHEIERKVKKRQHGRANKSNKISKKRRNRAKAIVASMKLKGQL